MNDDLDRILCKRCAPQTPRGLAERIIAQAAMRRERGPKALVNEMAMMFVVPRPAFALGFSILLGLLIGFEAGGMTSTVSESQDFASFLVVDEGGWL